VLSSADLTQLTEYILMAMTVVGRANMPYSDWVKLENEVGRLQSQIGMRKSHYRFNETFYNPEPVDDEPWPCWYDVLNVEPTCTLEEARAAYRQLCLERHPDAGGTVQGMRTLNEAWDKARQVFSSRQQRVRVRV
jgi:DnaJ-domain-containing protein 1